MLFKYTLYFSLNQITDTYLTIIYKVSYCKVKCYPPNFSETISSGNLILEIRPSMADDCSNSSDYFGKYQSDRDPDTCYTSHTIIKYLLYFQTLHECYRKGPRL
jgi:hypothetical protein